LAAYGTSDSLSDYGGWVTAEYRVDPETGDWHIAAPARDSRPVDQSTPEDGRCPFCPGNEDLTPPEVLRLPARPQPWRVRIVPNRYAVVSPAVGPASVPTPAAPAPATGRHEVVVESARHDADPRSASPRKAGEVLWAMRERCRSMAADNPAAIVVFRNHGAAAGTSLRHPHSQIVALDQAPPGLLRRWNNARRHFQQTGRCLHDDIVAAERQDGARVVHDADGIVIYQPRAAGMPHETVLLPADVSPDLAGASDDALDAVARLLPRVLAGLAVVRDDPAYNLVVHAGPVGDDTARDWYRWHVRLYPRVTRRAGLEIATGLGVNPTVPEHTAPLLRRAMAARATDPA
jgi:UDPglucose--hexose-1-phosphate uridylyltransferase